LGGYAIRKKKKKKKARAFIRIEGKAVGSS
jgi:hypothetical protein